MKAYLYVEGAKLREVNYIAHEVWAMHMGHTFRVRRLEFGCRASIVAVYVSTAIVDKSGPLPEEHRDAIAAQLKALTGGASS
jgi:hypothetical protein